MDEDGHVMVDEGDDITQVNSNNGLFSVISDAIGSGFSFIENYGWFILIGSIVLYYLYNYLKQKYPSTSRRQSSKSFKNEDEELERMRRIEEVRRKQQEALDAAARKYLEEKKKKEEKEAQQKAEEWERHKQGLGYKSKIKKPDQAEELNNLGLSSSNLQKKPRLRGDDYNPLLGSSSNSGGSCSFRPGKRGGARGG